jgi:hypothetical protein
LYFLQVSWEIFLSGIAETTPLALVIGLTLVSIGVDMIGYSPSPSNLFLQLKQNSCPSE